MIFNAFERMVAFRYLRARRAEGFVSVIAIFSLLGIALGVATLIIVMSVMNGFRAELVGRILGLNGHLAVYGEGARLTDFEAAAERVRQVPGRGQRDAADRGAGHGDRRRGRVGRAGARHPPRGHPRAQADRRAISSPARSPNSATTNIAVGERLARRLGVGVGGRITLISPEGTDTAFGTMPRLKTYRVAALFNVGFYEYDNSFIYVPLHSAQIFFRMPEAVSDLEVFVENPDRVQAVGRQIAAALGGRVRIVDWQQANSTLVNAVDIERNVMFLILALIILVASFNIISGMIMLVKDKGRDIAILRTMGASRGMILRIFMLSGASIGIVGTLAGFVLGVLFTMNIEAIRQFLQDLLQVKLFAAEIYFFTRIPAQIEPDEVAAIVADGAGAVVPRDALPVVAGRPARSGRGAALRMSAMRAFP